MLRPSSLIALGCSIVALGVVLAGQAVQPAASVVELRVPDRANATPWIASSRDFVAVAWGATSEGQGDIYLATSRDGARTFSAPVS